MTTVQEVLRVERDGVEYFTVVATGESGMSQTGLARACGVSQQAISQLVAKLNPTSKTSKKQPEAKQGKGFNPTSKAQSALTTKAPSKKLEPFVGKDFTLTTEATKNGGSANVYTAKFCAAVIKHYAKLNDVADAFDDAVGEIGLTSYIQSQTGWLPEEFKAAPEAHKKLDEFLGLAMEWDRGVMLVLEEWGEEADMSDTWTFFDEVTFAAFTTEEYRKYLEHKRDFKLHSHSKTDQLKSFYEHHPEVAERVQPYNDKIQRMLSGARNPQLFHITFFQEFGVDTETLIWELNRSVFCGEPRTRTI